MTEQFTCDPGTDFATFDDSIDLTTWQLPTLNEEIILEGGYDPANASVPSAASSVEGLNGGFLPLGEDLSVQCGPTPTRTKSSFKISKLMEADL